MKRLVLFVCSGNTCRSPMAEGLFRSLLPESWKDRVEAVSAGTGALPGEPPSPEARRAAEEGGVDIDGTRSRRLTADLVRRADLIVVMARHHRRTVLDLDPEADVKTVLLHDLDAEGGKRSLRDVSDPFGSTLDVYRGTFEEIRRALRRGWKQIGERLFGSDGGPEGRWKE
ncbi:MAG: low molecular weight protein arginine phosphatase [Candidatus Eisenbacteria bacterium]|nr:low molecular weight protein arginine phosphatase [Candidatus Eisenbacteria bacterium]